MEKGRKEGIWIIIGLILGFFLIGIWAYVCFGGVLKVDSMCLSKGLEVSTGNKLIMSAIVFVFAPIFAIGVAFMILLLFAFIGIPILEFFANIFIGVVWLALYIKHLIFICDKEENKLKLADIGKKYDLEFFSGGW